VRVRAARAALDAEHRFEVGRAVCVIHRREQVRLLADETFGIALQQRDVVIEHSLRIGLRALADRMTHDGMHCEAPRHRLLHEMPSLECADRGGLRLPAHLREHCEGGEVDQSWS